MSSVIVDKAKSHGFLYANEMRNFTFIRVKQSANLSSYVDLTLHVFKDLLTEDFRWQISVFDKMAYEHNSHLVSFDFILIRSMATIPSAFITIIITRTNPFAVKWVHGIALFTILLIGVV